MCSKAPNGKAAEVVSSVGNFWIICRSKSCAGRIYYFNTSTGDAVWNLSDIEVEKAKNRTKILQRQSDFAIEDCPEPPESPKDYSTLDKQPSLKKLGSINQVSALEMIPTKVHKKEIINNQFPRNPPQCDVPFVPSLGPVLWNVSPQQKHDTPHFSPPQPLINNSNFDQVNVSNQTETLSNRFKKYAEISHKNPKQTGVIKYQYRNRPRSHGYKFLNKTGDLRLLLYLKRKENILKKSHQRITAAATYLNDEYSEIKQNGIQDQAIQVEKGRHSLNSTEVEEDSDNNKTFNDNLSYEHNDKEHCSMNSVSTYTVRSYRFNTKDDDEKWLGE
ncbi:jg25710, partial [Pararge aegeria aegeria]